MYPKPLGGFETATVSSTAYCFVLGLKKIGFRLIGPSRNEIFTVKWAMIILLLQHFQFIVTLRFCAECGIAEVPLYKLSYVGLTVKDTVFFDVTPYSLVQVYGLFGSMYCFHLPGR